TPSGGHVTPGALSEHVKWTVTGALYQPFAFGDVVAEPTMVGGVLSTTVTSCSAVAVLCAASIAAYVIVVVPTENASPAGTPVRVMMSEGSASVATAVPSCASEITVPHAVAPGPVAAAMSFGTLVKTGGIVSTASRMTDGSWSLAW